MGMIFLLAFLIGLGVSFGVGFWGIMFQKKGLLNKTQNPWSLFFLISIIIFLVAVYLISGIITFKGGSGPPPGEFYQDATISAFLYGLSPGISILLGAIFNVKPGNLN